MEDLEECAGIEPQCQDDRRAQCPQQAIAAGDSPRRFPVPLVFCRASHDENTTFV